jgi:hypothetical protein
MAELFGPCALEHCVAGSGFLHTADEFDVIADAQCHNPGLWKAPENQPGGFVSIHLWHPTVHHHDVWPEPLNFFQGLLSVISLADNLDVFTCEEDQTGGGKNVGVVIHQKDPDKAP